jgi:hypothetical protein
LYFFSAIKHPHDESFETESPVKRSSRETCDLEYGLIPTGWYIL